MQDACWPISRTSPKADIRPRRRAANLSGSRNVLRPLALVSLAIKMNYAVTDIAKEKGMDPGQLTPAVRAKLLEEVTSEFNSHGVVSMCSTYAPSRHHQTCLNNLLMHASPLVFPEKRTPYKHATLLTCRWILGGARRTQYPAIKESTLFIIILRAL